MTKSAIRESATRMFIPVASVAFGGVAAAQPCTPQWSPLGSAPDSTVSALAVFDDGHGAALYAGGSFVNAGGSPVNYIAKWDGQSWSVLGSGMDNGVLCLTVFDNGSGPALYAGGNFGTAGGVQANRIARWDGQSWSAVGAGMNSTVLALADYNDGSGRALYAAGPMDSSGGVPVGHVAKFDGALWVPLGSSTSLNNMAAALAVFNDGAGEALYVGGSFTEAGGAPARRIAKWNGQSWSALGTGAQDRVTALTVFDDGGGPDLYAGGDFTSMGSVPGTDSIARWNGQSWSALATGISPGIVYAIAAFDDGTGPALYAGGSFTMLNGAPGNRIAKWNGQSWSALDTGTGPWVNALAVFDDGGGSGLYVGGAFTEPAAYVARWGCPPPPPCYPNCDGSTGASALNVNDFICFQSRFAATDPYADCDQNTALNVNDFICFQSAFAAGCP